MNYLLNYLIKKKPRYFYNPPNTTTDFFPSINGNLNQLTHHYNDKVEPAPGIGEILGKPQGQEFDQHLNEEDNSEDSVHVVEDILENWSVLKVHILQSLEIIDERS